MYQMGKNQEGLPKYIKLVILAWKYTIWQPWPKPGYMNYKCYLVVKQLGGGGTCET
jgi:hypothetical protein